MAERICFDLLPSTQDEAVGRARAGAPAGLVVVARRQHRGRGRLDHSWASPEGGLYLSMVTAEPRLEPGLVPVGVGAGLAATLAERYPLETAVKWPNDLFARAREGRFGKLAGVLVDRVLSPTLGVALVVGVGVNVTMARSDLPDELAPRVAILKELAGRPVPLEEVEAIVTEVIQGTVERLGSVEGRSEVWSMARRVLYGIGRPVRVDGRTAGVLRDLAVDGALLVEGAQGIERLRSGEIEVEGIA
jgi:BirA family transcriptional regulator, biotin operon repressor / biotin---[acetyl-CoA-carboxylase] ligase